MEFAKRTRPPLVMTPEQKAYAEKVFRAVLVVFPPSTYEVTGYFNSLSVKMGHNTPVRMKAVAKDGTVWAGNFYQSRDEPQDMSEVIKPVVPRKKTITL